MTAGGYRAILHAGGDFRQGEERFLDPPKAGKLRRPTSSSERRRKKKFADFARNDDEPLGAIEAVKLIVGVMKHVVQPGDAVTTQSKIREEGLIAQDGVHSS